MLLPRKQRQIIRLLPKRPQLKRLRMLLKQLRKRQPKQPEKRKNMQRDWQKEDLRK